MTARLISARKKAHTSIPSKALARHVVDAGINQKALDIRALDMSDVSDVADFFVVMSGTSSRHVQGIVDKLKLYLERFGEFPNSLSGYENAQWVLLDYGNVVTHIFLEEARHYYSVDDLWKEAQNLELPAAIENQLEKLKTGLYSKYDLG